MCYVMDDFGLVWVLVLVTVTILTLNWTSNSYNNFDININHFRKYHTFSITIYILLQKVESPVHEHFTIVDNLYR